MSTIFFEPSYSHQYYSKIARKYDFLNTEDTNLLALYAQDGDEDAKNELLCRNMKLIISRVLVYQGRGIPLDELYSNAILGFFDSLKNWNISKGMSFVSSARMHIDAFIKGIFVNKTNGYLSTCIPANILRTSNQIEKLMNKNSDITDEDLCKQLNLPISRINRAKEYLYNYGISSMNATINEEGETYEHYLGNNDENFKKFEESDKNNIIFKTLFKNIDQSKLNILKMYYGINDEEHEYTVKEIAKELKLDESIVRKHINSTLSECKKNAKTIKSYL